MSNKNSGMTRKLVFTAVFSAVAYILMLFEIPMAFIIPEFIKLDFSEIPALICAFAAGPLWGVAVCLIKNILHLLQSNTGGIGELANFVLGAFFTFSAGLLYKKNRTKKGALLSCLLGGIVGAAVSFPVNRFITYPFYTSFMPEEAVLAAYNVFLPVKTLDEALLVFNLPFTFFKFTVDSAVTFVIYKRISPLIKGK